MHTSTAIEEIIFTNSDDYFEALLADIDAAKTCINLETYIFRNDALGKKALHHLTLAAKRHVKVRVLVDGAGTPSWGGTITRELEAAGVETRVFHPLIWRWWQWRYSLIRIPLLFRVSYFLLRGNARNHRKVCLIDHQLAYVGSANIDQCHLSQSKGGKNWRDTVVKLTNKGDTELHEAFDLAWQHTTIIERIQNVFEHIDTHIKIRLNNTRHRRRIFYKNLLRRLSRSKQRVWITNAYFVPDNFLLRKLIKLAKAGIDVRILLPKKSDVFLMTWATTAFYQKLLQAGVRIFEYQPSMLHAKSLIIDNWFLVGSSNMNHRSLLHDLEVDVVIESPEAQQQLEQQFFLDLANCREIDWVTWRKNGWWKRFMGRVMLYLKYWI